MGKQNRTMVILQPGYLPWLGFFEQMYRSDIFVFYDDVQYDKNGWRNRNRIKTADGISWLTVPVHASTSLKVLDIKIDNSKDWQRKHIKALKINYSKASYFNKYWPIFEKILTQKWDKLLDLNIAMIYQINKILDLERKIEFASKLNIGGDRITRLINTCKYFNADTFYEGAAGKDYIDEKIFNEAGIKVEFQDYKHPVYHQLHGDFISYLSIVDLIFNEGPKSLEILINK
jgi:hypothetical protein